jgi:predicted Rossmann-fold nucleotide-binding protein
MSRTLGVFGSWRPSPGSPMYEAARACGAAAADAGLSVLTGGYSGIMEAAARGARDHGAAAIGVVCPEVSHLLSPTKYCSQLLEEPSYGRRLVRCIELSDSLMFFPGRLGTAAELTLAVDMVCKGLSVGPIILWGNFWLPFLDALSVSGDSLDEAADGGGVLPHAWTVVETPKDAVTAALRRVGT